MKKGISILLMFFLFVGIGIRPLAVEEGGWNQVTNIAGSGRAGAAIATIGDEIFIISGREGTDFNATNSVNIYNVKTDTWRTGTPIPTPTFAPAVAVIGNKIYLFSGRTASTGNILQIYDTANNTWAETMTLDFEAFGAEAAVFGEKIYLLGGIPKAYTHMKNNLYVFDTRTNALTELEPMPTPAAFSSVAFVGDTIYVFGGSATLPGDTTNVTQAYNITSGTWSTNLAPLPEKNGGTTAAVIDNKIYVMGGFPIATATAFLDDVRIYDIATNTWSSGPSLPAGRHTGGAVVLDETIYLVTGYMTPSIYALQVGQPVPASPILSVLLNVGEEVRLSVSHDLTKNEAYTWVSSDPSVATVDHTGAVTAISEGLAYIKASSADLTFEESIPVRVIKNADETRLAVHLNAGEKQMLYLTDDPSMVTWSSMDPTIATISQSGEISAVKRGLCIVQAEFEGTTYQIYIRVN